MGTLFVYMIPGHIIVLPLTIPDAPPCVSTPTTNNQPPVTDRHSLFTIYDSRRTAVRLYRSPTTNYLFLLPFYSLLFTVHFLFLFLGKYILDYDLHS